MHAESIVEKENDPNFSHDLRAMFKSFMTGEGFTICLDARPLSPKNGFRLVPAEFEHFTYLLLRRQENRMVRNVACEQALHLGLPPQFSARGHS